LPVTDADWEALPPEPLHCSVYVIVPAEVGVTDAVPPVGREPDQSLSAGFAEAVQALAPLLDQMRVSD